jgi:hypothetical protein
MFQSYKLIQAKDGIRYWEYELIDSEFGTVSIMSEHGIWGAVIQEYSKRNLNVAANLAVVFNWHNKKYPHWSIQELINYNKNHNPLFPPYEEDLQKYLVLL